MSEDQNLAKVVTRLHHNPKNWVEGEHLEFKRATNKLPDDIWETYSAFANAHGGIIMLGVEDNGQISGVLNPSKMLDRLATCLNNPQKISVNLCLDKGSFYSMELDNKQVIAIHVPAGQAKDKPVYYNGNMGNVFFRSHTSDVRCKEEMIQQMIRDKMGECPSSRLIHHTTWESVDTASWKAYRNRMMSYSPDHAWIALDDKVLMEKLGGYTHSIDGSEEGLTLAGLLMFGTDDAIQKFFPRYQINYYEYDGSEEYGNGKRWTERIYNDGSWNSNLYQFFFRILPRLTESLKRPFRLNGDLVAAQGETNVHRAIREALANAIVHADYDGIGGIIIRKYPDKTVFINPGTLLISREQMMRGGVSECRNLGLQTMFLRMGIVEKAGAGVDTIIKGWKESCFMPPEIIEYSQPYRIEWTLPFVSMISPEEETKLKKHIGSSLYDSLSLEQRLLLLIISHMEEAGHKDIREMCPYIHTYDLTKQLIKLEQLGCLYSKGKTAAKVYQLATAAPHQDDSVREKSYPESVQVVRNSKRVPLEKLQLAITDLCRNQWLTSIELSMHLNRKLRSLHTALKILEATERLELLHPDEPTHPRQAYRTHQKILKNEDVGTPQ